MKKFKFNVKGLLSFAIGLLVAASPFFAQAASACAAITGESEIPDCLK